MAIGSCTSFWVRACFVKLLLRDPCEMGVGIPGCPFPHLSTDVSFSGFVIVTLMFSWASSDPGGSSGHYGHPGSFPTQFDPIYSCWYEKKAGNTTAGCIAQWFKCVYLGCGWGLDDFKPRVFLSSSYSLNATMPSIGAILFTIVGTYMRWAHTCPHLKMPTHV